MKSIFYYVQLNSIVEYYFHTFYFAQFKEFLEKKYSYFANAAQTGCHMPTMRAHPLAE